MNIELSKRAYKELQSLDATTRARIVMGMESLAAI